MLIGFTGHKGVGKTISAQYLASKTQGIIHSLAEPLKQIAQIFGFSSQALYGSQNDKAEVGENGISAREFMQKFATEFGRDLFPTLFPNFTRKYGIWIHLLDQKISPLLDHQNGHPNCVLVDDIRFPDEVAYIRSKNGIIIQIDRPLNAIDNHRSETDMDTIIADFIIHNNTDLDHLYHELQRIYQLVLNRENVI